MKSNTLYSAMCRSVMWWIGIGFSEEPVAFVIRVDDKFWRGRNISFAGTVRIGTYSVLTSALVPIGSGRVTLSCTPLCLFRALLNPLSTKRSVLYKD